MAYSFFLTSVAELSFLVKHIASRKSIFQILCNWSSSEQWEVSQKPCTTQLDLYLRPFCKKRNEYPFILLQSLSCQPSLDVMTGVAKTISVPRLIQWPVASAKTGKSRRILEPNDSAGLLSQLCMATPRCTLHIFYLG